MIDLQPFVSQDESRPSIITPWTAGGWTYATDGRICVRLATSNPDDEDNALERRPNAATLFDFESTTLEAFPLPELKGVTRNTCEVCLGLGRKCCDLGHWHECDCDNGWDERWPIVDIGGARLSERYLWKIKDIPGLRLYPRKSPLTTYFTFDGGNGLVSSVWRDATDG
jgi:hypothetical protein